MRSAFGNAQPSAGLRAISRCSTATISREYDGKAGVEDTADEVRALRRKGIRVAAIFMGEQDSVPAADQIYGKDLARIRRMDQLAQAAGRLIQDQIRELAN